MDVLVFSDTGTLQWVKTPLNLLFLILILFFLFQTISIPPSWVAFFSPETYEDKKMVFSILETVRDSSGDIPQTEVPWMTFAYYPYSVYLGGLKIFSWLGMFFLVLNTANSKKRIDTLVYGILLAGTIQACYSGIGFFTAKKGSFPGGIVNTADQTAIYLGITIPLAFGFVITNIKKSDRITSGLGGFRAVFQRIIGAFSPESSQPRRTLLLFASGLMGCFFFLTAPFEGILSLGGGFLLFSSLFFSRKAFFKYGKGAVLLGLIVLGSGIVFSHPSPGNEFSTGSALSVLRDYPVAGVGFGNFKLLYPRYAQGERNTFFAENTLFIRWFITAAEIGLIGSLAIFSPMFYLLWQMVLALVKRRDLHAVGIGVGVLVGMICAAVQNGIDADPRIPAIPLTMAGLLGIGFSAVHRRGRGFSESFFYRVRHIRITRSLRIVMIFLVLLGSGGGIFISGRYLLAELYYPTPFNVEVENIKDGEPVSIKKALVWNSGNAWYHFGRYEYIVKRPLVFSEKNNEKAVSSLIKAIHLNPVRGKFWYELGKNYSMRNHDPFDYLFKWLPLADKCFDAALKFSPGNEIVLFNTAKYWVRRSAILNDGSARQSPNPEGKIQTREEGIRKFQKLFRRTLKVNQDLWKQSADKVWEYFPNDSVLLGIVPDDHKEIESRILKYLAKKG